jgi:hypothetical protein
MTETKKDAKLEVQPENLQLMTAILGAMQSWAEKRLLAYYDSFPEGANEAMEGLLLVSVLLLRFYSRISHRTISTDKNLKSLLQVFKLKSMSIHLLRLYLLRYIRFQCCHMVHCRTCFESQKFVIKQVDAHLVRKPHMRSSGVQHFTVVFCDELEVLLSCFCSLKAPFSQWSETYIWEQDF